jgi:hypothetical protein
MLFLLHREPGFEEVFKVIHPSAFWFGSVAAFTAAFLFILWRERDIRFVFYALAGSLTAFFLFDVPSYHLGFYLYRTEHYLASILGIPVSMTAAEGFCIAITIYAYEKIPWLWNTVKRK